MASLHGIIAACSVEMRRALRNRVTLVLTFVAPVAIAAIVVLALGDTDDVGPSAIGYVVTSSDTSTDRFVTGVVENPELAAFVEWSEVGDQLTASLAVQDEDLGAAIVVSPAAESGGQPQLVVLGDEDPIASGVAATIVDQFLVAHAMFELAAESGVALPTGESRDILLTSPGGNSIDASVHWGPALGAFFVLLSMGYAAQRQVSDRQRGIAGRVASTPTPRGSVVIGRAVASTLTGTAALVLMAASAQVLFGRAWGSWSQVVGVSLATAIAIGGIASVLAVVARTPGQAQTLTAAASFAFAIGGGSFNPPGSASAPGLLTRWLPTRLSLDGFSVVTTTGEVADLVTPVAALLFTGLSLFIVATIVADRRSFR